MSKSLDYFVGAMAELFEWTNWCVVGTDRRAVRELPATTSSGRRARRSRPTNDSANIPT